MEEEKKKVNTGIEYKNGKYRPSVFFDKSIQTDIEMHFKDKGYKSFNEYGLVLEETMVYNSVRFCGCYVFY